MLENSIALWLRNQLKILIAMMVELFLLHRLVKQVSDLAWNMQEILISSVDIHLE